jgi:hypothetical protein
MKIWNNSKAREFRKQIIQKRVGVCEKCGVNENFISERLKPFYKIPLINKIPKRKIA